MDVIGDLDSHQICDRPLSGLNSIESFMDTEYFLGSIIFKTFFHSSLRGIVHPKIKILSVFTHPHVVPTP